MISRKLLNLCRKIKSLERYLRLVHVDEKNFSPLFDQHFHGAVNAFETLLIHAVLTPVDAEADKIPIGENGIALKHR